MASSHIIRNIFVSASVRYLLATLIYVVDFRCVVDSCSNEQWRGQLFEWGGQRGAGDLQGTSLYGC